MDLKEDIVDRMGRHDDRLRSESAQLQKQVVNMLHTISRFPTMPADDLLISLRGTQETMADCIIRLSEMRGRAERIVELCALEHSQIRLAGSRPLNEENVSPSA